MLQQINISKKLENLNKNPPAIEDTLIGYHLQLRRIIDERPPKRKRGATPYVYLVREYAKEMAFPEAVEKVVDYCIKHGILAEFLSKNKSSIE